MKFAAAASLMALGLLSACATTSVPSGMAAGKFVSFSCEGGKMFSARAAEDSKSVRVRGLHGSAELDMKADGVYEGDGYTLKTSGADAVTLLHEGKTQGKGCKPA